MSGNTVSLEMETTDTNFDVAKRIGQKEQVDKRNVKLLFSGHVLPEDQCLEELKKQANSNKVALVAKERMHIDVEMMSGENMPHEMETTDNIMEIKKRIQDKAGVDPTVLKLHYSDDEQPNDTTLDILKNKAGSNSVSLVAKERVNVSVKMMSGAEDKFEMFTYDSVLDVKKKVSEKEHIEHILIHLNLDGAEIHDDQSLEDIK